MNLVAARSVILAITCALVVANPMKRSAEKCSTECSGSSKYRYQVGKSYQYQYETETKVKLAGVSENDASVKIESAVQISVISPCEFSLKLSQVKITGPSAADLGSDWQQELAKYVTRFSFDDGEIGEICPKAEEPEWSVNIKRAILSAFQNAQIGRIGTFDSYEEDVSGRCPTQFEVKDDGGDAKTITKTKNLVSCFNRLGHNSALRMIPYEVRSIYQFNPVIDSKQTCKQIIRNGRLEDSSCEEKHLMKRWNNADKGGIMATGSQKLRFVSENGNVVQGDAGQAKKLHFDHKELEHTESRQALTDARKNLQDLCASSKEEVRPETPGHFNELVYNLRKLSVADLRTLYQDIGQSSACETSKQCFLNALPMCSTTGCVSLVAEILKNGINQLTDIQKKVYFTSFALVPHVKKEMVTAVTPLIDSIPKEGLLGVSTLVHTYCREYPSCGGQPEVTAVVQKLASVLGSKCEAANGDARDGIIYALRALGNIGHSTESVDKRVNCLKEKTNTMDIRLAAVQSLRRTPCSAMVTPLKERFADPDEDVEIRLTSFLTFIKCATPEIVNSVKDILEREQVHQVGSFVRTYFEQVGASSDPCKQEIQNLLSSHYITKRFNRDPRKYSRFFETSKFSNTWNFGGHADSAVIFSPQGYMPRQGFVNLTIDAFGQSINLLEIGGRLDGIEQMLDKFFGPRGYVTNPTRYIFDPEVSDPHPNPKVVELQEKYGRHIKKTKNLDLSWYIRIFGDEVAYKDIRNIDAVEKYQKFMQGLLQGREKALNLARANQLINHYASIPTVSGLPLHLAANVTVALKVDFNGKLDTSKITQGSAEMRLNLKPSAVVERSFIFAIHAGHSKFGVNMKEILHSSTAANIHVDIKNGNTFKSSVELPKQKNEIIQYDIKLFTIKNNVPIEELGIQRDRVSGSVCTPDRLNRWIGFKLCHEASFANASSVPDAPYFPLTGPFHYAAILEKTDPNLRAYEFTASFKNTSTGGKKVQFSFNTPGSAVDREITLDADYLRGQSLAIKFKSPLRKIDAQGTLEVAGRKQTGRINIKVDNTRDYVLTGSQEVEDTANGGRKAIYKGEITRPGQQPIMLSATDNLELPPSGFFKRSFEFKGINMYDQPVEFKSVVERIGQREGKLDYDLKSPKLNSKVAGRVTIDGDIRKVFRMMDDNVKNEFDWTIEYQRPGVDPQMNKVELKYVLDYSRRGQTVKVDEIVKVKCSSNPNYNSDHRMILEKGPNQFEAKMQGQYGSRCDLLITISSKNSTDNKHTGMAQIKSTSYALDHKADFTYQNSLPNSFAASVKLDTPDLKNITAEGRYSRTPQQTEGEAKLSYPGKNLRVYKKLTPAGTNKYKSQVILQWETNKQIELNSDLTYNTQANDYELKTIATGTDNQQWTFLKKVNVENMSVKSVASLQKGQEVYYDLKLDVTKESAKKQKIQAQFRGGIGANRFDVSTDGSVEDLDKARKIIFNAKKGQAELLKGELIIPNTMPSRESWKNEQQKQVKIDLSWPNSSVMVDYQRRKTGDRTYEIDAIVKANLPQYGSPIDRKLNAKIDIGTVVQDASANTRQPVVNITWFKDNNRLLQLDFGGSVRYSRSRMHESQPDYYTYPSGFSGDIALKTFEPWTRRHVSTAVFVGSAEGERHTEMSLMGVNHLENRRFGFKVGDQTPIIQQTQYKRIVDVDLFVSDRSLKMKHTYERDENQKSKKLRGEIEFSDNMMPRQRRDAQMKRIVHEWSCVDGAASKTLTTKLQTPFDQLTEFEGNLELFKQERQHRHSLELKWNRDQNLKLQVKGDVAGDYTNVDGSLNSTITGMKSVQFMLKSDLRTGRDFEAKLDWNDASRLRAHHKRTSQNGDEKWSNGVEATIPNTVVYKALADVGWNTNTGKYKLNTESHLNGNGTYKVLADFDTKTKEGTVEVNTPTLQLRQAKAQVTKLSENEYELKMVQNSQTQADVKATLKLENDKQKVAVEVKNVQQPFKTEFEHEWTPTHFLIGGEFSRDTQTPGQTYGLKLGLDKPSNGSFAVKVALSYPSRKLKINYQRDINWPAKGNWSLEVQPNDDQPSTKIQFVAERPTPDQCKFGLHVTKGTIGQLHLLANVQSTGVCTAGERRQGCQYSGDVSLKYSDDPNKLLTHKFNFKREMTEQRPKYSYEWESKHPATGIQVKHHGSWLIDACVEGRPECKRSIEAGIEILDKQKQNKVYKYKFETDSFRTATSEITSPTGRMGESYRWDGEQFTMAIKRDNRDIYQLTAGFDRPDKEYKIELKDAATSEVIIHAGAKKPGPDSVELVLWHSTNQQKVEDISIITALRENSRIRSRLYVRPALRENFKPYMEAQWNKIVENTRRTAANDTTLAHLIEARQNLRQDIANSLKPMVDQWQQSHEALSREFGVNFGALRDLVVNYAGALRSMRKIVEGYFKLLLDRATSTIPSQTLNQMWMDVQAFFPQQVEKALRLGNAIAASFNDLIAPFRNMAANWHTTRDDIYRALQIDELRTYFATMFDGIRRNPTVQRIIEFFTSIGSRMPNMDWDFVRNTASNLNSRASQAATDTRRQVDQQATVWWNELLRNNDTSAIARFLQEAYNRIVWHLSRAGPGDQARGFYEWTTQEFRDLTTGGGVAREYMPRLDVNDQQGVYVVEAPLPGNFKSLDEIVSKFHIDRLRNLKVTLTARVGAFAQDADYAVRDILVNIQPSSMSAALKSPLASTAILAGDQHFITFDDQEFDFAGECDYLLARDFAKGEFTISVSFERAQGRVKRKSITVEYWGSKVEIFYDNKVKINGAEMELPWHDLQQDTKDMPLAVFRRGNSVIVKAIDDLTVECDGYFHICRIIVPRRFHARSGGLLGTNDFEPNNDFTKPDHRRTTNVAEFAREWTTSANCAVSDNRADQRVVENAECMELLNDTASSLRTCYHRLSPEPFYRMCSLDADQPNGKCTAVVAYVKACEDKGVGLDIPGECIQCKIGEGSSATTLVEEQLHRMEDNQVPNFVDVVFIVEERKDLNWTQDQMVGLARKIDTDLKQQRYDVRFGVVGFNGEGVHYDPHFHTGQGQLSMVLAGVQVAVEQLAFTSRKRRLYHDPLAAVKFAAEQFPFRAGTRKLLVLFSQEECSGMQVDYFELQSELLQMAIGLQLVTNSKIELATPNAPQIIALDAGAMYTADGSEKRELRPQLVEPHDSCTVLTQETHGTVFSFSHANVQAIMNLLAQKLVRSVGAVSKCQICECQEHEQTSRTVCFPCEIPRPASLTGDNTGFFNNPFVRLQKWQKKAQETLTLPIRNRL